MSNESFDAIRLQMAMAFGQGAGSMLASPEALSFALSGNADMIERAAGDWTASKPTFIYLVRVLGQIAAARAAMDGVAEIEPRHVEAGLTGVLQVCPCFVAPVTRRE
jgi:hypothetical protein